MEAIVRETRPRWHLAKLVHLHPFDPALDQYTGLQSEWAFSQAVLDIEEKNKTHEDPDDPVTKQYNALVAQDIANEQLYTDSDNGR
jgi:hypothetical protein